MVAFSSAFDPKEVIIDDSTSTDVTHSKEFGRGLDLGLKGPEGYGDLTTAFPAELAIDPSEFQARIQELEERGSRLSDFIRYKKIPAKNQRQTNYCWINAPVGTTEVVRAQQNQEYVSLSPASAGAQIKNYKNNGGWGKQGLEFIVEQGLSPSDLWPDTAIDRKYATTATKKRMLDFRVTEWMEMKPRNMTQLISCLLRRIPVAVGYNWWGHEVYACDALWLDGTVAIRIRNSWYLSETVPWGDNGFGILKGSKMPADDAVAPRVAIASGAIPINQGVPAAV